MTKPSAPRANTVGASPNPEPVRHAVGEFERACYAGAIRSRDAIDASALEHLAGRLRDERCSVLSLEVFDTLLLRNDKCERRRQWEIAERWTHLLPKRASRVRDLYLARRRATEICAACGSVTAGAQSARLDNIVGVTLALAGAPPARQAELVAAELAYEVETLAPSPLIVALANRHLEQGGRVVLLADSSIPGQSLHELLRAFGIGHISEHIYSSADTGVSKRSGTIFEPAARAVGVQPADILHLGADYQADFAMPRLKGWAAQHLPVPLAEARLREADERAFLQALGGEAA